MTSPQAWKGDYTQLRFYPSRGVCAVTVEIPLEEGTAFVAAFGTPLPKSGIPIALARIDTAVETKLKAAKKSWDELPLMQQAGILCGEASFVAFVAEKTGWKTANANDAAEYIRANCAVVSRRDLDGNPEAGKKFLDLVASYEAWKLV